MMDDRAGRPRPGEADHRRDGRRGRGAVAGRQDSAEPSGRGTMCVVLTLLAVITGRAIERRRLGPGSARHQTLPLYVMAGWLLAMACALVVVINLPDPYG